MKRRHIEPTRTKMLWPVVMPADLWIKVRAKAIGDATTVSAALSEILEAGIEVTEFDPLPPDTGKIRLAGTGAMKDGRYFLPIALAEKVEVIRQLGYSNAYILVNLIRAGLQRLEEEGRL